MRPTYSFSEAEVESIVGERYRHLDPRVQERMEILWLNALSVCALLRKIASRGGSGPITLVMDNARYQRCALVQGSAKELGIELLCLPSYSPNLNLIDRLWKFVKKEVLNSRHHQDFKKFQEAIDGCLAEMPTKHHEKLATLLTHTISRHGTMCHS